MIKNLIVLLILVVFFGGCMNQENKVNAIDDPFESDQEVIKKLLIDIFATAKARDMDRLDAYHLNGPKFSKFDDGDIPDM